jgi:hypothetical protein
MCFATRSNSAGRRASGALSSCPAVSGIPLEDPSISPGGPVGRLACLVSPSIQPGGARVPRANTQRLGSGITTRWSESDSDLPVRRPKAALGTPPNRRTSETHRVQGTTKGPSDATTTTDPAEPAPSKTDIAGPQRDRAQNPVNTTRTCNKLRSVNWFTGEVS